MTLDLDADGDVLDSVWSHPYTRTWLGDALQALLMGRPDAVARALRLPCYLASALVAAGVPTPVPVPYEHGLLHLPGLGVLRIGDDHESGIHERGTAEVEPTADGFTATVGGTSRRVRLAVADDHWHPVRTVGGTAGAPLLRLDDLDRYRDCFGSAALPRLSAAEVRDWDKAFTDAWKIIRAVAPEQSAEVAHCLGTLTPSPPTPLPYQRFLAGRPRVSRPCAGTVMERWALHPHPVPNSSRSTCCGVRGGRSSTPCSTSPISMHRTAGGVTRRRGRTRRYRCPNCWRESASGRHWPPSTPRGRSRPVVPSTHWRGPRS